jgi:hypothetical protein
VTGKTRVQPAYKIDSSLVSPLGNLPAVIAVNPAVLAERNLLRGLSMSLPSGQTVARHMCIQPIDDAHLRLGKLTNEDFDNNPLLVDEFPNFRDNAPLWYYILAEVQQQFDKKDDTPLHLGPVGGRIVAEVFAGLILGDNHSFLAQQPCWKPLPQLCRDGKHFGIADLITFARSQ